MFGTGATGPGNLADYYTQVSGGMLGLNGTVVGPVTVSHTKAYYDTTTDGARLLVREAVSLADPTVDFSPYDNDHNGTVDDLIVVYAGGGVLDGCYPLTTQAALWPHSWGLSPAAVTGD
jgi:immune inhibitor A